MGYLDRKDLDLGLDSLDAGSGACALVAVGTSPICLGLREAACMRG